MAFIACLINGNEMIITKIFFLKNFSFQIIYLYFRFVIKQHSLIKREGYLWQPNQ